MELKNQVCSLEPSKKLKTLGVKQESLFHWYMLKTQFGEKPHLRLHTGSKKHEYFSAFTVAELGEMLPDSLRNKEGKVLYSLNCTKRWSKSGVYDYAPFWVGYENLQWVIKHAEEAKTEADARAKCLIYLLENGIIKHEEISI